MKINLESLHMDQNSIILYYANKLNPDYYLVLPWHFRNSILEREKDFINKGGKFIFPFPYIEIVQFALH